MTSPTEPTEPVDADLAEAEVWADTVLEGVADHEVGQRPPPEDNGGSSGPGPEGEGRPADPAEPGAEADDPPADAESRAGAEGRNGEAISVEDLVADLERVSTERDQYLDASRRIQAEFENYKKQVAKREAEARERANDSLIGELLPVLDAFDGALASGVDDVAPMANSFLDSLVKQGLERIEPIDAPFDPTVHEAVLHEDDDDTDGPVVVEVMRAGYLWKGRVLRPAMVKTRG